MVKIVIPALFCFVPLTIAMEQTDQLPEQKRARPNPAPEDKPTGTVKGWPPSTFDRILLDPPCSGLGTPLIVHERQHSAHQFTRLSVHRQPTTIEGYAKLESAPEPRRLPAKAHPHGHSLTKAWRHSHLFHMHDQPSRFVHQERILLLIILKIVRSSSSRE